MTDNAMPELSKEEVKALEYFAPGEKDAVYIQWDFTVIEKLSRLGFIRMVGLGVWRTTHEGLLYLEQSR